MAYRNQQEFINALEKEGELTRIKTFVDPRLEIAEITDRIVKAAMVVKHYCLKIPALISLF
jgi:4-hydroxy-3-polyprenylbenzoate decarboxylase